MKYNPNAVLLFLGIAAIMTAMYFFATGVANYDNAYNECVVSEYESGNTKDRKEMYEYCRSKARLNK